MTTFGLRIAWMVLLCLTVEAAVGSLGPFSRQMAMAQEKPKIAELDPALDVNRGAADGLDWHDATQWGVEGRILSEKPRLRWFDRLPTSAQQTVTANVWNLSRDSAGMLARFSTDASHASDLGFMRQAEAFAPILRAALAPTNN